MGSRGALVAAFVVACVGALVGGLRTAAAGTPGVHEDPRMGYEIRYPKGWTYVAMGPEEKWIVAKYLADKSYAWTDPTDGQTWSHKPKMTVIGFIAEVVKRGPLEIETDKKKDDDGEEGGDGEDGEDDEFFTLRESPYKDYQDYMKQTYSGGGWFVSAEEDGDCDGVPVKKYEIKVEKLTNDGPKRIVTWVFHTEAVDLAVQFEVLENHFDKLKGELFASLKSFRLIPRTKAMGAVTEGEKIKIKNEDKLTPEERAKQRKQQEETQHRQAIEALGPGWTAKQMGRFLVLNHADEKYAKKVVAHAEAVWSWLDKEFAYIGPGEYMRRPIIRICKDAEEVSAFQGGGGTSLASYLSNKQPEILTYEDKNAGAGSFLFEWVNRGLVNLWFADHSPGWMRDAPWWIDYGLHQVLGTARSKGSTLEFKVDDWERDGLREAVRAGKMTPVNELVMLGYEDFHDNEYRSRQAGAFVRFLLSSKKGMDILKKYVLAIDEVVADKRKKRAEASKDDSDETETGPETEEEEDEQAKKRDEKWKQQEKELLQKAAEAAFPGWDDKAWKRLHDEFIKSF